MSDTITIGTSAGTIQVTGIVTVTINTLVQHHAARRAGARLPGIDHHPRRRQLAPRGIHRGATLPGTEREDKGRSIDLPASIQPTHAGATDTFLASVASNDVLALS